MSNINIIVVDYKMSNIFSIKNIFSHLGLEIKVTSSAHDIRRADAMVLPGVGAFGEAMFNLEQLELINPIKEFITSGKSFLGICLGLQLLFSKSNEFGEHAGLGIVDGEVVKFSAYDNSKILRLPNIGWNIISECNNWDSTPLNGIKNNEFVYFSHSYYVKPRERKWVLSTTRYGDFTYCSSIQRDNVFATQFHPEKSGKIGLVILQNWINLIKNIRDNRMSPNINDSLICAD